ncbi:protein AMBP-like [Genypterus blacodes]|uniref:protein AMBP-like n=1 Tax=Genypterus blacodes TaxID=154954 RepID=UPI003F75B7FA
MHRALSLVSVLVLGWVWTMQAVPVLTGPQYNTAEDFDLGRFLGKWYEVAVVSTCPYYMQDQRRNPAIAALELQPGPSEREAKMTTTVLWDRICKQTFRQYGLTNTPGRFFYYFARFEADVDCFVVDTNYDEYAFIIQLSTERPSGLQSTTVKLHSRSMNVSASVLEDFKAVVIQQGMNKDTVIMKQNKGECVPGEQVNTLQLQGESS